jgi:histidinol-phosphate/aromatic aminotransferase/cobyric acid decarboxylase-like protein
MTIEDTYITGLNRYPDPHQIALKQLVCNLRNSESDPPGTLAPANLFCGVGSDEAIDAIMRVFCKPTRDKLMISSPTYGMYKVCAAINEVEIVDVPLVPMTWQTDIPTVPISQWSGLIFVGRIDTEIRCDHQSYPLDVPWQSNRRPYISRFSPRAPIPDSRLLERRSCH